MNIHISRDIDRFVRFLTISLQTPIGLTDMLVCSSCIGTNRFDSLVCSSYSDTNRLTGQDSHYTGANKFVRLVMMFIILIYLVTNRYIDMTGFHSLLQNSYINRLYNTIQIF